MLRKLFPIIALGILALLVPQQDAHAQPTISDADTMRVLDSFGDAGDVVPVRVSVSNNTATLMGVTAFFEIDTTYLEFDGIIDDGTFFVNAAAAGRSILPYQSTPDIFNFQPLVMVSANMRTSSIVGAGNGVVNEDPQATPWLETGSGVVFQFNVRIKPGVPEGTEAFVRIFHPYLELFQDTRACQYSDHLGLQSITCRLVSGSVTVGDNPNPTTNSPPVIAPLSQSNFVVDPGTNINFSVSASDVDAPQPITLRIAPTSLPSGASFGTGGSVTGNGSASGTFNWTPNASQAGQTYNFTFTCTDDSSAAASPRGVSITVNSIGQPDGDVLYTISQPSIGPVSGGTPGLTGLNIPVALSSTQSIYGVQFDFVYNPDVIIVDSLVPTDRLENFTVYDNIGDTPGRVRVVAFGLNNEEIQQGSDAAIVDFWITVRGSALPGEYPLFFENAYEAISPDPFVPSVELDVDENGVFVVDEGGDVNGDGRVDIADLVHIVGYIIEQVQFNLRQFTAADMDRNGFVDVIDLQTIINQIFGGTPPSFVGYGGNDATLALNRLAISGSSEAELYAELPTDVAGVQVEINYNPAKLRLRSPLRTGMSESLALRYSDNGNGKMIVLLYPGESLSRFMQPGAGALLDIPIEQESLEQLSDEDLKISYAVMVDPTASEIPVKGLGRGVVLPDQFTLSQNYPNPFNPETTIEFAIKASSAQHARLSIYNLLGQHVHTLVNDVLPPGNYTYTWYGRTESGTAAASGVYFYRLIVGDAAQTRKMVLLK